MDVSEREALEAGIRQHHEDGQFNEAATIAINAYGPELMGYLLAVLQREWDASDAFANLCEAMWTALPKFRWECSFRTWVYTLARSAVTRHLRDPHRKLGSAVPLSQAFELREMVEQVRTATLTFLRTESKNRVNRLRQNLSADDQTLLILRVNQEMSWSDIARIMSDSGSENSSHELQRKSNAMRKRFQRVKELLREKVRADGLS